MEDAVKNIGEELITEAEPVALAESGGNIRANDNFPVGEGEDVGGSGVSQMLLMKAAAFAGRDDHDADVRRQTAEPGGGKAPEGGVQFTTKIGQARRMPSWTVDPPDGRLFWFHGGPWGNGCGGEAGFPRPRQGLCERPAIGKG